MRPSAIIPAIGSLNTSPSCSAPSSAMPTPPMEPSRPACGTHRRMRSPTNVIASLKTPIMTIAAMPTCQARIAASATGRRDFAATNAGPSTANAIPMVEGESRPSGIAVTSERPVRFASRNASHVYARSPIITPSAVPGNIFR
jgi:hypothetical protein